MNLSAVIRDRLEDARVQRTGSVDLRDLGLTRLPDELTDYPDSIIKLFLDGNEIADIDTAILGELRHLLTLQLNRNRIEQFPEDLNNSSLMQLNLDGNGIRYVRIGLSRLPSLRFLSLRNNGVERIDPDIVLLAKLETLDLDGNIILRLPDEIGSLGRLRELILSNNPDLAPPNSINRLHNLSLLDLRNNNLLELHPELGRLSGSVTLNLTGNFFDDSLQTLVRENEDSRTILRYLRSLDEYTLPNEEAKLLLVGEGNVGKTSLVEALRGKPFVEGRETTHGIEINTVNAVNPVGGPIPIIKLRSWDFGGQEVYRITHQFFFSPRSVYLVVWRPREGQDDNAVEPWIRRIRLRVGDSARIIVVATHGEERRAELDRETLRREFGTMLAGFCVVDSKTRYGFDTLLELLGTVAGALPQIGQPLNVNWIRVRTELLSLSDEHIKRSTFDWICAKRNVDEEDADSLARLLADLGHIVYFPDDDSLKDVMVLQPEWITKAISGVLEDEPTREAGGLLDHHRLAEVWSQRSPHLPVHLHRYILRLMEKFDVSYRIPDTDKSLVGQLVPYERPEFYWLSEGDAPLTLECEFGDHPPGLIPWLIVRNHRFATGKHWRKGVLLHHPECETDGLYELITPTLLRLQVRGSAASFFFDILRDTLTYLCDTRWPGLTYKLFVPCQGPGCTGRFPLRSLEILRAQDEQSVTCLECLGKWSVHTLLTGFHAQQDTVRQVIRSELVALRADLEQNLVASRAVLKALATEVSDCPRLFAIHPENKRSGFQQHWMHVEKFRLTLWCEEPGAEHPVGPSYAFRKPPDWIRDVLPYLLIAARTIAVLAPTVGKAAGVLAGGDTETQRACDFMSSIAEQISATNPPEVGGSGLTRNEGAALRRFRELLIKLDPQRRFAGLRRVLSPTGDYLWVCPAHYETYEPGLPILPRGEK